MKVITGLVVDGKIEFDADLREGTAVAILAQDDSGFRLSVEEEGELVEALDAIRRGEYVDGHELLRELRGLSNR